jgi:predicted nucleic acid-binding protein
MKVVIDTNVLVSAALKDKDPEAVILFIVARSDFEWVVSPEILAEY